MPRGEGRQQKPLQNTSRGTRSHVERVDSNSPHLERVLFAAFLLPVNKEKLKTAAEQRRSGVSREELRRLSTCPGPFPFLLSGLQRTVKRMKSAADSLSGHRGPLSNLAGLMTSCFPCFSALLARLLLLSSEILG